MLSSPDTTQIGSYQLDFARQEVTYQGSVIQVQPKVLGLIAYLFANKDRVVNKEELITHLWQRSHVSDAALTQCVTKARKLFEKEFGNSDIIRTAHGQGYRFVYQPVLAYAATLSEKQTPQKNHRNFLKPNLMLAAGVLFLGVLLVIVRTPESASTEITHRVALVPVITPQAHLQDEIYYKGVARYVGHILSSQNNILQVNDKVLMKHGLTLLDSVLDINQDKLAKLKQEANATSLWAIDIGRSKDIYMINVHGVTEDQVFSYESLIASSFTEVLTVVVEAIQKALLRNQTKIPEENIVSRDDFINQAFSRGLHYYAEGQQEKTLDVLKLVIDAEADSFWAHYYYAETAIRMRQLQEASAVLQRIQQMQKTAVRQAAFQHLNAHYDWVAGKPDKALLALETLVSEYELHKNKEVHNKALVYSAMVLIQAGKLQAAKVRILAALAWQQQNNITDQMAVLYNTYAKVELRAGNLDKALELYKLSVTQFQRDNDVYGMAINLRGIAQLYQRQNQLKEALVFARRALDLREQSGNQYMVSDSYQTFADIALRSNDKAAAFDYQQRSLDIALELNDLNMVYISHKDQADLYLRAGDLDKARQHIEHALAYFKERGLQDYYYHSYLIAASIDIAEQKYQSGLSAVDEIVVFAQQQSHFELGLSAKLLLADIYVLQNKRQEALVLLQDALLESTGKGRDYFDIVINLRLHRLYLLGDEFEQAEYHFRLASEIQKNAYQIQKLQAFVAAKYQNLPIAIQFLQQAKQQYPQQWSKADEAVLGEAEQSGVLFNGL